MRKHSSLADYEVAISRIASRKWNTEFREDKTINEMSLHKHELALKLKALTSQEWSE